MKLKELELDHITTPLNELSGAPHWRNRILSVSRLELFERCPAAFYYRYIEKVPGVASLPLLFGTLCHAPLEDVYQWVVEEEYSGLFPRDLLTEAFNRHWEETGIAQLVEAGFDAYSEGQQLMQRYVVANPEVDHLDVLATEQRFEIPCGDWTLIGFMDRVDRRETPEGRSVVINDYKTNRVLLSRDEARSKLQASLYILAGRIRYPWAKEVTFAFDMLRHGTKVWTERTGEELRRAFEYVQILARQSEGGDYPAKLNSFCGWCDYRDRCEIYQETLRGSDQDKKLLVTVPENIEDIASEREQVAQLAKLFYKRKEELDKLIKTSFQESGPVQAAGMVYRWNKVKAKGGEKYEPDKILPWLIENELGEEDELNKKLITIDTTKLKRIVSERLKKKGIKGAKKKQLLLEMESLAKISYTTRLDARKDREAEAEDEKAKKPAGK